MLEMNDLHIGCRYWCCKPTPVFITDKHVNIHILEQSLAYWSSNRNPFYVILIRSNRDFPHKNLFTSIFLTTMIESIHNWVLDKHRVGWCSVIYYCTHIINPLPKNPRDMATTNFNIIHLSNKFASDWHWISYASLMEIRKKLLEMLKTSVKHQVE